MHGLGYNHPRVQLHGFTGLGGTGQKTSCPLAFLIGNFVALFILCFFLRKESIEVHGARC